MTSDDILQPISVEKWPLLAETLKNNWPFNVQYYYFIQTALRWRLQEPNIPITIYCPNGDYISGNFVATSTYSHYFLIIFAREGFEELLYKAVTEAKFIKWNEGVLFPAIQSRQCPLIYSIIDFMKSKKGLEINWSVPGNCYFKSKEECADLEIKVPDDCYLKELDETDVSLIHSEWPHRNEKNPRKSTNQVLAMVRFNGGFGLYSKNNDELLSWATQSEIGAISLVQTIERSKRKGYAKIVTNAFAKHLSNKGIDSFVFVIKGNRPSELMFRSLGYKHVHEIDWILMNEKEECHC